MNISPRRVLQSLPGVKAPNLNEYFGKIYGALAAKHSASFVKNLLDWINKSENFGLHFNFKLQDVGLHVNHNKLVMYIPPQHLPKVAEFLAMHNAAFHPLDFNYPLGIHLMPGISAVLANENKGTSVDQRFNKLI